MKRFLLQSRSKSQQGGKKITADDNQAASDAND